MGSRILTRPLDCLDLSSNYKVFGPVNKGGRYDGIHFRGRQGKHIFTEDIINALGSAGMTRTLAASNQMSGREGVVTYNRFSPLN